MFASLNGRGMNSACWICLALLVQLAISCNLYKDVDSNGALIQYFSVSDYGSCCAACLTYSCNTWTYQPSTNGCWVKSSSSATTFTSYPGLVSGTPPPGTSCNLAFDVDSAGSAFAYFSVSNYSQCCAQCLANPSCRVWTYQASTNGCWLKNNFPSYISYSGLVSGSPIASSCAVTLDGDLQSSDFQVLSLQNASQCCQTCLSTSPCIAWTYQPSTQSCWIKTQFFSPPFATSSLTSGVTKTAAMINTYVLSSTFYETRFNFNLTLWPTFNFTNPTGNITLSKSGTVLKNLDLGSGQVMMTFNNNSAFMPGTYQLVATHQSTNSLLQSPSTTFSLTIPKFTPTVNLIKLGAYYMPLAGFNYSITTIGGVPATGNVSLWSNFTGWVANGTLIGGKVTLTTNWLNVSGYHNFTTIYSGDQNYSPISASFILLHPYHGYPYNLAARVMNIKAGANTTVVIYLRYDIKCKDGGIPLITWANVYKVGTNQPESSCESEAGASEWFYCSVIWPYPVPILWYNGTVEFIGFELSNPAFPNIQGITVQIDIQTQCQTEDFSVWNTTQLFLAVPAPPPVSVVATQIASSTIDVAWTPAPDVVQQGWLLSYQNDLSQTVTTLYLSNSGVFDTQISGLTTGATYYISMSSVSYINGTTSTSANAVTLV